MQAERFSSQHPLAFGRWLIAWETLWCADSTSKVLALGRGASEAIQASSTSLLERHPGLVCHPPSPGISGEPVREPLEGAVVLVAMYRVQLGEDRFEVLQALLEQWRLLAELVRLQDPGADAERRRLRWKDARRLVLFTALVMVETIAASAGAAPARARA